MAYTSLTITLTLQLQ